MSTIKVEGSIGQPIVVLTDKRAGEGNETRFAKLMVQALPKRTLDRPLNGMGQPHNQRYRVLGGRAAGVVCEISEREGDVHLKVKVPQYALYIRLLDLAEWLTARMKYLGHPITLEIEHVHSSK